MRQRLGEIDIEAETLLPPAQPDRSGIGVNFVDRWIRAVSGELESGEKVTCKRKGLQITLTVGERKGEALLRRIEHGPDPRDILREALAEAASAAGCRLEVEDGAVWLEVIR